MSTRSKHLQPHEYNSGTFTLSNLGMFGVDRFDAILPPGQVAIMAVGASKPTAVADKNGYFNVKSQMTALMKDSEVETLKQQLEEQARAAEEWIRAGKEQLKAVVERERAAEERQQAAERERAAEERERAAKSLLT